MPHFRLEVFLNVPKNTSITAVNMLLRSCFHSYPLFWVLSNVTLVIVFPLDRVNNASGVFQRAAFRRNRSMRVSIDR